MKSIFFAIMMALIILFSGITALTGVGMMVIDIATNGHNLIKGFEVFSLSMILLFVTITSYITTKILTGTDVLVDVMTRFLDNEISKSNKNPINNSIQSLFSNLGGLGGFQGTTSIQIGKMDEDGNITPMDEQTFSSTEEFMKHRDEILAKAFGHKPTEVKKKLADMSVEELKVEEKKAVDKQDFELAAAIVNLIEEKKKDK